MAQTIVPLRFQREFPLLSRVILDTGMDQVTADKFIRRQWPEYRGTYDPSSREAERTRNRNRRIQVGGTYSLECCQGGSKYHHPGPDTRGSADPGVRHKLTAHVAVSDAYAQPEIPVAKVAAKTRYTDAPVDSPWRRANEGLPALT